MDGRGERREGRREGDIPACRFMLSVGLWPRLVTNTIIDISSWTVLPPVNTGGIS